MPSAASKASPSTTLVTRPSSFASAASKMRPVVVSSIATSRFTSSGSAAVAPMSGMRPHFASMTENFVPAAATRTSAPSAIWKPPPKQTPWTAATTGHGTPRHAWETACARLAASPSGRPRSSSKFFFASVVPTTDLRSRPAENARPSYAVARTNALTPGVPSSSVMPSAISVRSAALSEFTGGRCSVSTPTSGASESISTPTSAAMRRRAGAARTQRAAARRPARRKLMLKPFLLRGWSAGACVRFR
mmetsp:Transcript_13152/g.40545  ORF Transcript_13152/g.40545 Transcript_13152/m.40545 type:complete len:248 (-) Transcript_13152:828-1571(-)